MASFSVQGSRVESHIIQFLISCNKNISAQIQKFKDLFPKTIGARERKIFSTLLPALKQVYSVRLFVCMMSFIVIIFPSETFEVHT